MAKAPDPKQRFSAATIALVAAAAIAIAVIIIVAVRGSNDGTTNTQVAATNTASPQQAIDALRQQVTQNPDDARAWFLLAMTYRETRQFPAAEQAFRRAMELEPQNVRHVTYLAESLLLQGSDAKRQEARQLLERASTLDSTEPMVRFYRATLKDLDGDHAGSVNDLIALLTDAPPGAGWEPQVRQTVQEIARANNIDIASRLPTPRAGTTATSGIPGPSRQQLDDARNIPPAQQNDMARGMVDRLAQRLQQNPRDADRWIMMMRSRVTLGEQAQAQQALRSALAAFQDDAATQQRLREAATQLGIPAG